MSRIPPWSVTVILNTAGTPLGRRVSAPRETTTTAERFSLRSISAFTQTPGSRLGSATGFPLSCSQLLIRHLIGAPSPSYCKRKSSVTFGKARSSDEACKFFTRSMAASSSSFVYECCAHSQQLKSTNIKLAVLLRISLLDTARENTDVRLLRVLRRAPYPLRVLCAKVGFHLYQ